MTISVTITNDEQAGGGSVEYVYDGGTLFKLDPGQSATIVVAGNGELNIRQLRPEEWGINPV